LRAEYLLLEQLESARLAEEVGLVGGQQVDRHLELDGRPPSDQRR
jgi:hypothetical protein